MAGKEFRTEKDSLGEKEIPANALWGIHSARAKENFPVSGNRVHPELIKAFGEVKLACIQTNRRLGYLTDNSKAAFIEKACAEVAEGLHNDQVICDALQGGAGTSTNMNINEVVANRALQLAGKNPGEYQNISPLDDIGINSFLQT